MTQTMRRKVSDHVYSAGVHVARGGHVSVLCGSRDVSSPCLRLLDLTDTGHLEPWAELVRPGTSVRCSVLLETEDSTSYITGGEDGVVRLWRRSSEESEVTERSGGKIGGHEAKVRSKPYSKK